MRTILFIDRDGVILQEPPVDYQVDSYDKYAFVPGVIGALSQLRRTTDAHFVMVTNQDGLGTDSFPEDTFWPVHNHMLSTLKGEGFEFDAIHIDPTMPEEHAWTRKPGTGMLGEYIEGNGTTYDLTSSFVIGDRTSDLQLAKNLGCRAVWFSTTEKLSSLDEELREVCAFASDDWKEVLGFLQGKLLARTASCRRETKETKISIDLNLDGTGSSEISTGLHFFDHMLDQVARHSGCDLHIDVDGDLEVDEHHTVEDTALTLGKVFLEALGDKRGISRYGFLLPMDDSLAQVAIDFSGRPWLVWDVEFTRDMIGDVPSEMFYHFFKSFSDEARCNLNISAHGNNSHHIIEAVFKGFARAIKGAVARDLDNMRLPSTKGSL